MLIYSDHNESGPRTHGVSKLNGKIDIKLIKKYRKQICNFKYPKALKLYKYNERNYRAWCEDSNKGAWLTLEFRNISTEEMQIKLRLNDRKDFTRPRRGGQAFQEEKEQLWRPWSGEKKCGFVRNKKIYMFEAEERSKMKLVVRQGPHHVQCNG